MLWPKKNSCKENSLPPHNFSNGPSLRKTLYSKEAECGYHNVMQFNYTHELSES